MSQNSSHRIKTLVYGSCVSRDTFEYLDQERFELTRYIARQSLISAFSAPNPIDEETLQTLKSPFQRRTLSDDFACSLQDDIRKFGANADLILWDLTDERFGVYETLPATYVTRSLELVASGLDSDYKKRYPLIPYGSRKHLELWAAAVAKFAHVLEELAPSATLILLAPPWSRIDSTKKRTHSPIPGGIRKANRSMQRYIAAGLAGTRAHLVDYRDAVADAGHPWGRAPYHYDANTYQHLTEDIERTISTHRK